MHTVDPAAWRHEHDFGQGAVTRGERRTLLVALLTAAFMVVEVGAGLAFGSMALLADGLHMASHAVALGIAVAAYVYARRRASDARFSFGTGKVNALGGYARCCSPASPRSLPGSPSCASSTPSRSCSTMRSSWRSSACS